MEQHDFYGIHALGEIYDVEEEKINNLDFILNAISQGVKNANATCIGTLVKKFEPQGLSILMLLSESHVSIHTYPEYHSLFIDAFTCGKKCDPKVIINTLVRKLNSSSAKINVIERGPTK